MESFHEPVEPDIVVIRVNYIDIIVIANHNYLGIGIVPEVLSNPRYYLGKRGDLKLPVREQFVA